MLLTKEELLEGASQIEALYPYAEFEVRLCLNDLRDLCDEILANFPFPPLAITTQPENGGKKQPTIFATATYNGIKLVQIDLAEYDQRYVLPHFYVFTKSYDETDLPVPLGSYLFNNGELHQTHLPKFDKLLLKIAERFRPR